MCVKFAYLEYFIHWLCCIIQRSVRRLYLGSICHALIMGFPRSSVGKESCLQCRRPQFDSWVRKICWRRDRLPTPVFSGFPGGSDGKESTLNVGNLGSIPGLGRSPGERNYPLQYSGLERQNISGFQAEIKENTEHLKIKKSQVLMGSNRRE